MAAEIPNLVKRNGICWFLSQTVDEPNKLGPGFQNSTLYYMAKPYILQRDDFVNMKVPEWLLNSMCAVWNSGIEVIYAKDPIGDTNYRNAYIHGTNAWYIFKYLPKLVNE